MKVFKKGFILLLVIFVLAPIIFMIFNSFISPEEIYYKYTPLILKENKDELNNEKTHFVSTTLLPDKFSIEGYINILTKKPIIMRTFLNSIFIVSLAVLGNLLVASISGYGFSFLNNKMFSLFLVIHIILILLPTQITMVSQYFFQNKLGIENGIIFIILSGIFNPIGVFLLSLKIKTIPKEYIDLAKTDGASIMEIFIWVIIPLLKPSLVTLGFIIFSEYYNIVEQAMVFIKKDIDMPLSFFLSNILKSSMGDFFAISVFYIIFPFFIFKFSINSTRETLSYNIGLD